MKILVTGAAGMLGSDVLSALEGANIDAVGYDKSRLDITHRESVRAVLKREAPTHVINCTAYTSVDDAEEERDACFAINVIGVRNLVSVCSKQRIKLIHMSTDYVFDGAQPEYEEGAETHPVNYYGESKALGEVAVKEGLRDFAIVRTSWLFGLHGKNFVNTMLKLALTQPEISVVNDQIGCPTYTQDLAEVLLGILDSDPGIYHVRNEGQCSWFEFASEIIKLKKLPCSIVPCSSETYLRKAKRPKYSVLRNTKLPALRHWKDALEEYINRI